MSIVVDIKTRVFDDTDVAYRLFPGQGYRHYQIMKNNSVVFLDNPGIPLPSADGYAKDDDLLVEITKSEEKQSLIYADDVGLDSQPQHIDTKVYEDLRWGPKRDLNRGWLNALYHTAKIGDLVVVPSPGLVKNDNGDWVRSKTLVGEISQCPRKMGTIWSAKYDQGPVSYTTGSLVS